MESTLGEQQKIQEECYENSNASQKKATARREKKTTGGREEKVRRCSIKKRQAEKGSIGNTKAALQGGKKKVIPQRPGNRDDKRQGEDEGG